ARYSRQELSPYADKGGRAAVILVGWGEERQCHPHSWPQLATVGHSWPQQPTKPPRLLRRDSTCCRFSLTLSDVPMHALGHPNIRSSREGNRRHAGMVRHMMHVMDAIDTAMPRAVAAHTMAAHTTSEVRQEVRQLAYMHLLSGNSSNNLQDADAWLTA